MTTATRDWDAFITTGKDGASHMDLAVDGITCAACIYEIERAVAAIPQVLRARVNFTSHRLSVDWQKGGARADDIVEVLDTLGYRSYPFDPAAVKERGDKVGRHLLRALAVSGFATMNIMLLSISVWSGNVSDIDDATRQLFHWISAFIAMPTVVFAGQTFYKSAWRAIKSRHLNMDVPITIGVCLATGLSLWQTLTHAHHAYFDSAVMLLFFLLAGRYFDHMMRRKTRAFAENLSTLRAESAAKIMPDGALNDVPLSKLAIGDRVLVRAGERVAVDGRIIAGTSHIDQSLVTGETALQAVGIGHDVFAGTQNGDGVLTVEVTAATGDTLLAEVNNLLETAMESRSRYVKIADRASQLYAPLVHTAALLTLIGWLLLGAGPHTAITIAISVLIITCPCALGLAIPAVQVVASGLFFDRRVLLNSGDAIERLAKANHVVFDKTGTLTQPQTSLMGLDAAATAALPMAANLAAHSAHPLSKALVSAAGTRAIAPLEDIEEHQGQGLSARLAGQNGDTGQKLRLGSPEFCGVRKKQLTQAKAVQPDASFLAFSNGDDAPVLYAFAQALRPGAAQTVAALRARGFSVEILSGDQQEAVARTAETLGIESWQGALKPQQKIAHIEALKADGTNVLMVGDGLNDAPALAAANVSLSPVSAVHVSQAASDAVFLGEALTPVIDSIDIARAAHRVMQQNLWISSAYNVIAVPIAVVGWVTPLLAAIAMSLSSIVVTLNAVRLRLLHLQPREDGQTDNNHAPLTLKPQES
ncbi:heavy metal translocating P-type ATPase [Polycladidibacter hongkongensis]|uniref:heavy metal translocating P-type ATPase n=1 Tax=Polycladidibacter hongkongensis TaxID=1647556 RepID=UPI00082A090E|nr:heavy metal translocating P-type ATPase [Pseudovibrio hongkongensis]